MDRFGTTDVEATKASIPGYSDGISTTLYMVDAGMLECAADLRDGASVTATMRAAAFVGSGKIEVQERPVPQPAQDEVLVKVDSCALCGTDRRSFLEGSEVTPGHETSGAVVDAGRNVDGSIVGSKGVVYLVDWCGACVCCRRGRTNMCLDKRHMYGFSADGGFADFVAVKARCFRRVPDGMPLDQATALLDLLGTSTHAFRRACLQSGESVAVLGCGPIGIGAVAVARALGAASVTGIDIARYRLDLVERLGASTVDATNEDAVEAVRARIPEGCDLVVEAAGSSVTQKQAIGMAGPGGRVVFVAHNHQAISVSTLGELIQFERTLIGSEYFPFSAFDDTESVMNAGRVDVGPLLTHRFPLEQIQDAFELFLGGESGKVLVGA